MMPMRDGVPGKYRTVRDDPATITAQLARNAQEAPTPWALIVMLVVLWLASFLVMHVGGVLIHLLLVIAVIVLIYQLITGRHAL
jgi:hypothetical protein